MDVVRAYQVDSAGGGSLVGALLVDEKQSLAGLARPGSEMVILKQRGDLLNINGLGAKPKELLGVDKVPGASQHVFQPKSKRRLLERRECDAYLGKLLPLCSS